MSRTIHAIFEDGVFKPTEPVDLPPHAHVTVTVETEASPERAGSRRRSFLSAGCGDSGRIDVSERAEELLQGFGED